MLNNGKITYSCSLGDGEGKCLEWLEMVVLNLSASLVDKSYVTEPSKEKLTTNIIELDLELGLFFAQVPSVNGAVTVSGRTRKETEEKLLGLLRAREELRFEAWHTRSRET